MPESTTTPATELLRLHYRLLMLVCARAPAPTIRACADQYDAALDAWLREQA